MFNAHELLHVAKAEARNLAEGGYRPPLPERRIQVAGDVGIATFRMLLVNMLEGRFISEYDNEIATRIATVLMGDAIATNMFMLGYGSGRGPFDGRVQYGMACRKPEMSRCSRALRIRFSRSMVMPHRPVFSFPWAAAACRKNRS